MLYESSRGWRAPQHIDIKIKLDIDRKSQGAKIILTTNVATNFYINITFIPPCGSPGVLHNPVWDLS